MGKISGPGLYPAPAQVSETASFPPWKVTHHGPSYLLALLPSVMGKRSTYHVLGTTLNCSYIMDLISKQPYEVDILLWLLYR